MADGTRIEWTEATWNPITGCSIISPGCTNCYAMKLAGTRLQHHPSRAGLTVDAKAGPVWIGKTRFNEEWLDQPLRWRRSRMIFVCAHGDLFHESVPNEWIDRVFAVMALAPHHTFQVLTKRAARMREYLSSEWFGFRIRNAMQSIWPQPIIEMSLPFPNVWLGVSVEDKTRRDRVVDLAQTQAAVRWISGEPLLEDLSLTDIPLNGGLDEHGDQWLFNALTGEQYFVGGDSLNYSGDGPDMQPLDWIVVGGESGPGARPMHPAWVRSMRDQCADAGVPFFFKQWGEYLPEGQFDSTGFQWAPGEDGRAHWWKPEPRYGEHLEDGHCSVRVGKKVAGRQIDGVEHNEMPVPTGSEAA